MVIIAGCGDSKPAAPAGSRDAAAATAAPVDAATRPPDAARPIDAAPAPTIGDQSKAAFPELFDLRIRWVYEIVEGTSLATLKPIKGTPRIFAVVDAPTLDGALTIVHLSTRPELAAKLGDLVAVGRHHIWVVFDADGIRQLAAQGRSTSSGDLGNIRGFTFPHTFDGPTTIQGHPDFGTIEIALTRERLAIAGEERDLLVAQSTMVEAGPDLTFYEQFAYAPGLGPALLCAQTFDPKDLLCLRLTGTEPRRCLVIAQQLCEGKDPAACDEVYRKLQLDPSDGEPMGAEFSEKACDKLLADPAQMERLRQTLVP
jgi:hypothetical protein